MKRYRDVRLDSDESSEEELSFEEDFEGEDIAEKTDNSPEETAETVESTDNAAEETTEGAGYQPASQGS